MANVNEYAMTVFFIYMFNRGAIATCNSLDFSCSRNIYLPFLQNYYLHAPVHALIVNINALDWSKGNSVLQTCFKSFVFFFQQLQVNKFRIASESMEMSRVRNIKHYQEKDITVLFICTVY